VVVSEELILASCLLRPMSRNSVTVTERYHAGQGSSLLYITGVPSSVMSTAHIVCIRNGTVSVRLSRSPAAAEFDGFAPVGRIYRSIAAVAACECGQCHVVSVRR